MDCVASVLTTEGFYEYVRSCEQNGSCATMSWVTNVGMQ